jgi:regulatory protein
LSLKARAIGLLANREHSRQELGRKLLRLARAQARREQQALADGGADSPALHESPGRVDAASGESIEALLDWLQAQGYLSETRFVESRVHARAARYGNLRIQQELAQHGVAPDEASQLLLKQTELARARQVWERKFGQPAQDAAARAKQMRFLAARGFSGEVIRKVVQGTDQD